MVDNKGYGSVAGHVAGSAEAVHGNVDGYHEPLQVGIKAEHAAQQSEGGHDGTTRHTGGGNHGDGQHHDEADIGAEIAGKPHAERDGVGHSGDFKYAARHVDGGAEGHGEACRFGAHTVLDGLLKGYRDGGGTRCSAEGGDVGGQHGDERVEGVWRGAGR